MEGEKQAQLMFAYDIFQARGLSGKLGQNLNGEISLVEQKLHMDLFFEVNIPSFPLNLLMLSYVALIFCGSRARCTNNTCYLSKSVALSQTTLSCCERTCEEAICETENCSAHVWQSWHALWI